MLAGFHKTSIFLLSRAKIRSPFEVLHIGLIYKDFKNVFYHIQLFNDIWLDYLWLHDRQGVTTV